MRIPTKLLLLAVAVAGLMGPAIGTKTEDLSTPITIEEPKPEPTIESVCKEIMLCINNTLMQPLKMCGTY